MAGASGRRGYDSRHGGVSGSRSRPRSSRHCRWPPTWVRAAPRAHASLGSDRHATGRAARADSEELGHLYDVSILTYVGCPSTATRRRCSSATTSISVSTPSRSTSPASPPWSSCCGGPVTELGVQPGPPGCSRSWPREGGGWSSRWPIHCSAAGVLADRLGLGDAVRAGVEQSYARWDGRGVPRRPRGQPACTVGPHLACRRGMRGVPADRRRGSRARRWSEPGAVRISTPRSRPLVASRPRLALRRSRQETPSTRSSTPSPIERAPLTEDQLDLALEAIGDFCDLRCSYLRRPREGYGWTWLEGAAQQLQLPAAEVRLDPSGRARPRRRAFRSTRERLGTSQGRLTASERERMRMHVYYVERIFNRPEPLRRIGLLAATHHERMDGSGYHRGVGGTMLSYAGSSAGVGRRVPRHAPAPSPPGRLIRGGGCPTAAGRSGRRTTGSCRNRRRARRSRTAVQSSAGRADRQA